MFSTTSLKIFNRSLSVIRRSLNSSTLSSNSQAVDGPYVADFRSDTMSLQTPEMRTAMFSAVVGDDSYGEDPTVIELEETMAKMMGKEAALYVTSGHMGNLASVMAHCTVRASEMIVGDDSHIHISEQGCMAQVAGVHSRQFLTRPDGTFDLEEVKDKIREKNVLTVPETSLICLENTHNRCGGTVLPLDFVHQVYEFSQSIKVPLHIDGARLCNAAVHLKVPLSDIAQYCDSVTMCFSKGLGAPIGSIICGTEDFIKRANYARKVLGGAVRQSGYLAAAALEALKKMNERLSDDHVRAFKLAKCIADLNSEAVKINLDLVHTNIVLVHTNPLITSPEVLCERMAKVTDKEKRDLGAAIVVRMRPYGKNKARLVVCLNNSDKDIELTTKKLKYVISQLG